MTDSIEKRPGLPGDDRVGRAPESALREFHGGSTLRSFARYPETLAFKQRPESFSQQLLIVRDKDL